MENTRNYLKGELKSKFVTSLSDEDKKEMNSLTTEISQLKNNLIKIEEERSSHQVDKERLSNKLTQILLPTKEELTKKLASFEYKTGYSDYDSITETDVNTISKTLQEVNEAINKIEDRKIELNNEIEEAKGKLEEYLTNKNENISTMQSSSKKC